MHAYPWFVVAVTCIGAFIGQLDARIVQLTLPTLERDFHATLASVSRVVIDYRLAYASTLPVFARLSEILRRKWLYIGGFAVFTIASFLCGFASDLEALIAYRLLQDIGEGCLGQQSHNPRKAVEPNQRGRAMKLFAAAQAVGIGSGPVLGGVLLGSVGW